VKSRKRVEDPQIEEFACLGVKFRKACDPRVISREACEDRVKFRNSSQHMECGPRNRTYFFFPSSPMTTHAAPFLFPLFFTSFGVGSSPAELKAAAALVTRRRCARRIRRATTAARPPSGGSNALWPRRSSSHDRHGRAPSSSSHGGAE
jgi:hypothetical protein